MKTMMSIFTLIMVLAIPAQTKEIPKDMKNYYGPSSADIKCEMYTQKLAKIVTQKSLPEEKARIDYSDTVAKQDLFCNEAFSEADL